MEGMEGRIHSVETLGGVDGPGIRYIVYFQGCPLRCRYCHNPDTWRVDGGQTIDSSVLVEKITRCVPYFSSGGGLTLSGGEPFMQPVFALELLKACKVRGIHTAVDTSGCLLNQDIIRALEYTDLVILDVKALDDEGYRWVTQGERPHVMEFLDCILTLGTPLWVRQVIIPGFNDTLESVERLASQIGHIPNLRRVELLPYHTLGNHKWKALGMKAPLMDTKAPTDEVMEVLNAHLQSLL